MVNGEMTRVGEDGKFPSAQDLNPFIEDVEYEGDGTVKSFRITVATFYKSLGLKGYLS